MSSISTFTDPGNLQHITAIFQDPEAHILFNMRSQKSQNEYINTLTLSERASVNFDEKLIEQELSTPEKVQHYAQALIDLAYQRGLKSFCSPIVVVGLGKRVIKVWLHHDLKANVLKSLYTPNIDRDPDLEIEDTPCRPSHEDCVRWFKAYMASSDKLLPTCLTRRVEVTAPDGSTTARSKTHGLTTDFSIEKD